MLFLTRDIMPVLAGLAAAEVIGKIKISVSDAVLKVAYQTTLAAYTIHVPTCTPSAKRNSAAFAAYVG
jgi:hypothetical protein